MLIFSVFTVIVVASAIEAPNYVDDAQEEGKCSNLYVTMQGVPVEGAYVYSNEGIGFSSGQHGLVFAPPCPWSVPGTILYVVYNGESQSVPVGRGGLIRLEPPDTFSLDPEKLLGMFMAALIFLVGHKLYARFVEKRRVK